ncbi:MAG: ABC transporter substrate binding protein [Bermanella sp.]
MLCPPFSWGATAGLLVDSKSDQAQSFHRHLVQLVPELTLSLHSVSELSANPQLDRWLTIGPKALTQLLSAPRIRQPILALFLTPAAAQTIRAQFPHREFSLLDNTPSLARQLSLIKVLTPHAKRIAVFYSAAAKGQLAELDILARRLNFQLLTTQLNDPLNWQRDALKTLKDADLVLALNDSAIYNATNIRSILMRLYRAGKPLVGPGKAYVRAGAVASTYSGVQETLKASATLLTSDAHWPALISNPHFKVRINTQVARSLNIVVGDEEEVGRDIEGVMP